MKEWFLWFGRWHERDRAYGRLSTLRQEYGGHGERVIRLSARTDLARKSAGSTQRAFDLVEQAFAAATQEYARVGELLESVEVWLRKGEVREMAPAETALSNLGPKLDELERQLATWEARWQQVPLEVDSVEQELSDLRRQVDAVATAAGAPLPLLERLKSMEQHLARIRSTLAAGNPVEADHLVADLRIAIGKLAEETGHYMSGVGAISQAEQELAALRAQAAGGASGEAVAALAAAEALLPRLRPALAGGKLEQFQHELYQFQRQMAAARSATRQ